VLLPNNLTPFVEAGAMAGAPDARTVRVGVVSGAPGAIGLTGATAGLAETLAALTGDDAYHAALVARARAFAEAHGIRADGGAAARAVEAISTVAAR
jgi:hypothetical protein